MLRPRPPVPAWRELGSARDHRSDLPLALLGPAAPLLAEVPGPRVGKDVLVWNHKREFPIWIAHDGPLLGSMNDGSWGKWLHLLQLMCHAGKVRAEGKPPKMVYHAS